MITLGQSVCRSRWRPADATRSGRSRSCLAASQSLTPAMSATRHAGCTFPRRGGRTPSGGRFLGSLVTPTDDGRGARSDRGHADSPSSPGSARVDKTGANPAGWFAMATRTVTHVIAAKRLGCATRTIERMLRDGRLKAVHERDRLLVDANDLELVLADRRLLRRRWNERDRSTSVTTEPRRPLATTAAAPNLTPRYQAVTPPVAEQRPSRPGVTPLSLEPAPIPPTTEDPPARHATRPRLRHPAITIATALALAALLVWMLNSSGPPRQQASGKSATKHHETPAPTHPVGSAEQPGAPTTGGREHAAPSPTSRGGVASLIVPDTPARIESASRTNVAVPAASASLAHSQTKRRSASANCGFGSLTYGAC